LPACLNLTMRLMHWRWQFVIFITPVLLSAYSHRKQVQHRQVQSWPVLTLDTQPGVAFPAKPIRRVFRPSPLNQPQLVRRLEL
jgi:hypothetical protein